jgi:lipoate-protein ligase A
MLDTGLRPARLNVAMTAALAARHADGKARDTVRFHRYHECVLLGRSQRTQEAVDMEHCRQSGIDVVHRVTGGGAVYMSPRMLAWDVVVDRRSLGGDLDTATRRICEGVAAGLSRLGCAARFRPANDIEIAGLKVSGSSGYAEGRTIALQGTILIEDDVSAMARALRIPGAALRERVTCLAAVMGSAPALRQVQTLVVEGLMTALGRTPLPEDPSTADLAEVEALLHTEAMPGRSAVHVARGEA